MARTMSVTQLDDVVMLMTAAIDGLTNAKLVDPTGQIRLHDLKGHWADPVWTNAVQAAWVRINRLLGQSEIAQATTVVDLPAFRMFERVGDLVGWVDTQTGAVRGVTQPEPLLLQYYGELVEPPSNALAIVGFGLAGVAAGVIAHQALKRG